MKSRLRLTDNPTYAGLTPRPLGPGCHDGSPMIDIQCTACGNIDHLHETVLATIPKNAIVGCRCQACHHVSTLKAKQLRAGFAEMRRRGWIA